MKIEIVYKSKRNTKKVAEAMGQALNVKSKNISDNPIIKEADILFLGCGIYAGDVHRDVYEFVGKLNHQQIKKVVLFSTSAKGEEQMQKLKDKIKECKLNLDNNTYCCKGKAMIFMNREHPNTNDLNEAVKFAESFL